MPALELASVGRRCKIAPGHPLGFETTRQTVQRDQLLGNSEQLARPEVANNTGSNTDFLMPLH